MMKNNILTASLSSKKILFPVVIILLIGLVAGGYLLFIKDDEVRNEGSNESQPQSENLDEDSNNNDSVKETEMTPPSTADENPKPVNDPFIEMYSFSQENSSVNTTVKLSNVSSNGKCVFMFTDEDARPVVREVTKSGDLCTVSIPEVEFSKIGIWQLNVSYYLGTIKQAETNQNVTIN